MGFMHLKSKLKKIQTENETHLDKNLKMNSIQVLHNLFSFQTPFKVIAVNGDEKIDLENTQLYQKASRSSLT